MFYSKSTGGFYTAEIHGINIPADAVAITPADHAALLAAQSAGKIITGDAAGLLPTSPTHPEPTMDQTLQQIARNALDIDTLETQRSDRLDFHDVAVWSLKAALEAAYQAGQQAAAGIRP